MDGTNDLSNLFGRVSALEQENADTDRSVTRIVKSYPTLGLKVIITAKLHQYRLTGDSNPIYFATCAADTYI